MLSGFKIFNSKSNSNKLVIDTRNCILGDSLELQKHYEELLGTVNLPSDMENLSVTVLGLGTVNSLSINKEIITRPCLNEEGKEEYQEIGEITWLEIQQDDEYGRHLK